MSENSSEFFDEPFELLKVELKSLIEDNIPKALEERSFIHPDGRPVYLIRPKIKEVDYPSVDMWDSLVKMDRSYEVYIQEEALLANGERVNQFMIYRYDPASGFVERDIEVDDGTFNFFVPQQYTDEEISERQKILAAREDLTKELEVRGYPEEIIDREVNNVIKDRLFSSPVISESIMRAFYELSYRDKIADELKALGVNRVDHLEELQELINTIREAIENSKSDGVDIL